MADQHFAGPHNNLSAPFIQTSRTPKTHLFSTRLLGMSASWFDTYTPRMCSRVRAQAVVVYQASCYQCGAPGNDSCRERVFSETLWVIEKND